MLQDKIEQWGYNQVQHSLQFPHVLFSRIPHQYLTNTSILLSFIVGFLTTLVIVSFEIYLTISGNNWFEPLVLLQIILINGIFIGLEFYLLFKIGLASTAQYIRHISNEYHCCDEMKRALVRSALEISEPKMNKYGIQPYREQSKIRYLHIAIYSGKDIISNFVIKAVLKKYLSRSSVRIYIPLISTLITGFWDAWVQMKSLRDVRLKLDSRIYAIKLLRQQKNSSVSAEFLEVLIRLIAVRLSYKQERDVTLEYLLDELQHFPSVDFNRQNDIDDPQLLKQSFSHLNENELRSIKTITVNLFKFKRQLNKCEKQLLSELV